MSKGEKIRKLREQNNLTQEQLAKKLNTTKQTISKYEKGIVTNIPSDRLETMAEILNTTPEYILGWETVQKNNDIISDAVIRMRTNEDFLSVVKKLMEIDDEQVKGVNQMLNALIK
jgi:transcriptional regulator with XRE-family HTH domain